MRVAAAIPGIADCFGRKLPRTTISGTVGDFVIGIVRSLCAQLLCCLNSSKRSDRLLCREVNRVVYKEGKALVLKPRRCIFSRVQYYSCSTILSGNHSQTTLCFGIKRHKQGARVVVA